MSDITTPRASKRFRSLGLLNGFNFNYYVDLKDVITDLSGDQSKVLAIVNSNLSAHSTATEARDQFTADLEAITGFAFLTKEVKGTGKNAEKTRTVPNESEAEYVARLKKALLEGVTFKPASDLNAALTVFTTPPDKAQDAIDTWLQAIADVRTYTLDARVAERTAKEKGLPKYAVEAAERAYEGNKDKGLDGPANWLRIQKTMKKDTGTVLPDRTGDATADKKALAAAIVANEHALSASRY